MCANVSLGVFVRSVWWCGKATRAGCSCCSSAQSMINVLPRIDMDAVEFFPIGQVYEPAGDHRICGIEERLNGVGIWNKVPELVELIGPAPPVRHADSLTASAGGLTGVIMIELTLRRLRLSSPSASHSDRCSVSLCRQLHF